MKKDKTIELGKKLLKKHGLEDWEITIGQLDTFQIAPVFAGCNYQHKEIRVNRDFVGLMTEKDVRGAILHEMVHAIVKAPDESKEFQKTCKKIGAPMTQNDVMDAQRTREFTKAFWGIT